MHCQKVRSYLSAYCNDELTGSASSGVSDHLATCTGCRTEEQHFRDLLKSGKELNTYRVSEGFNNRLLDRIAHERFAETRTKAYFPKSAPSLLIRRLVPILVTAGLAVAVVIANFSPNKNSQTAEFAVGSVQLDDAYLTVQPDNNPNLPGMLHTPITTRSCRCAQTLAFSRAPGNTADKFLRWSHWWQRALAPTWLFSAVRAGRFTNELWQPSRR